MNGSIEELHMNRVLTGEVLASCQNHIESLQNLSNIISQDAEYLSPLRLNIEIMEWHIRNLAELILPKPDLMLPSLPSY
jgi:hypothetical protein